MIQEALESQLGYTQYTIVENLTDISHEDSLASPGMGGNSINWVLGHIVRARNLMLDTLGGEPVMSEEQGAAYARHSGPIGRGSACLPLEELVRLAGASQKALVEKLEDVDDAALRREVPSLFEPDKTETAATHLAGLVFHEAYHAGQLGVIRRAIGKEARIQ